MATPRRPDLVTVVTVPEKWGFGTVEAAKFLGMHPQTLRDKSDLGEIPCKRIGRHRIFLVEELRAWMQKQPDWISDGHKEKV